MTPIAEYSATEAVLADLRSRLANVVYDVSTMKGLDQAKKDRAEVRGYRTALEKKRVEIKSPALERCRQIDTEAKRITEELLKLEGPPDEAIKAEETRKENERLAKVAAEQKRVTDIQQRIAELRGAVAVCSRTGEIASAIANLEQVPVDDSFAEFRQQAEDAKGATLAKLREMHSAAVQREETAAKAEAERQERETRLKAEEERQAKERARLAEEEKAAQARRSAQEASDRQAREAEDRKAREALAAERKQQEAEFEARRAEQLRLDQEAAKKRQTEEKRLADDRARLDREQAVQAEAQRKREILAKRAARQKPADSEIVDVLAAHFDVEHDKVIVWLKAMDLELVA